MKPRKIRDQSIQELENERTRLEEQIFKLRFQNAVGQLDNPLKIRTVRRDLARVRTIMNEKLRAQASAPATEG